MRGCRSCGEDVMFVPSQATGRRMILDAAPTSDGNVYLTPVPGAEPAASVLSGEDLAAARSAGLTLYMPHHATCPQADRWRTRGRVR